MSYTLQPTRSIARIKRQIEIARREKHMVVLHPDTVEWLLPAISSVDIPRQQYTRAEVKKIIKALAKMPRNAA